MLQDHWYQRPKWGWLILLSPLEWLFRVVSFVRREAYRLGIKKQYDASVPLVVIGNLNVGGVGKTPLTQSLLLAWQAKGLKVGVVSRGYGGQYQSPTMVKAESSPLEVGDEPCLLAMTTGAPIAVAKHRIEAVKLLLQHEPDLDFIISDDGLQHYAMGRQLEIVVVDGERGFGNGHLLPNGPLRESSKRLETVDALVVNGQGAFVPKDWPKDKPMFSMQLQAEPLYALSNPVNTAFMPNKEGITVAMAGIGHPERFFQTLKRQGVTFEKQLSFPDHYQYQESDIPSSATWILVTEKDAVKLKRLNHDKIWVLPVRAQVAPNLAQWIIDQLEL